MIRADFIGILLVLDWPLLDFIKSEGNGVEPYSDDEARVTRWVYNAFRFITVIADFVRFHNPNLWTMSNSYIPFQSCLI